MSTFNGIGTQFVGECCQEEDGSYIATYWFTISHIPIIPFYSARIHGQYSEAVAMGYSTLTEYEKLPLYFPQVIRTYAYLAMIVGLFHFLQTKFKAGDSNPLIWIGLALPLLALPWIMRYFARKKAGWR